MLVQDDLYIDPDKALAELSILGSRLESADQLAKTYGGYQKMFDVGTFDQSDIEAGNEKFNTIKKMWETVKLWTDKYKLWMESEFTELQVEEIAKDVDMMFKDCFSLNKKLGSKISELLRDKVSVTALPYSLGLDPVILTFLTPLNFVL